MRNTIMRTLKWQRDTSRLLMSKQGLLILTLRFWRVSSRRKKVEIFSIKEAARLERVGKIAIKCQRTRGSASRNLTTATMQTIPKASYGWFCGKASEATFRQVDWAVAQVGPTHTCKLSSGGPRPHPFSCLGCRS